ncbi:TM2 domain-containing protein [Paenibacillus piri]|uniref:TM2 domain-containing protein n=2 Tax=Paenibacillus piri TaxID=2547395 RepID=A0A4R5KHC6_9BACL|nr:TM2 domain-containing protein [Paenibacillus piri]
MSTNNCPACGAPVAPNITECKYCGEALPVNRVNPVNQSQGPNSFVQTTVHTTVNSQSSSQETMTIVNSGMNNIPNNMHMTNDMYNNNPPNAYTNVYVSTKSKTAAGLLAIFLGGFGIHKFYLGRVGWGIVYLLFCWTYIPSIVGFIEGIIYLASSDQSFNMKYGKTRTY